VKMEIQPEEVMVDWVFNFQQHLEIHHQQ